MLDFLTLLRENPYPGRGILVSRNLVYYFISTYQGDGNPLPTFAGEPLEVTVPKPEEVWAALNGDNKVSLYTNVNGEVRLFNKNLGD